MRKTLVAWQTACQGVEEAINRAIRRLEGYGYQVSDIKVSRLDNWEDRVGILVIGTKEE